MPMSPSPPQPTPPLGHVFAITDPVVLASNIADVTSPASSRSIEYVIAGNRWDTTWCLNNPALQAVDAPAWSYTAGVISQLTSIIGTNTITCNETHLRLMFVRASSFFLLYNDSVTFNFQGDYTQTMSAVVNPDFIVKFVADQPGAYPPTTSPATSSSATNAPQGTSGTGVPGPASTAVPVSTPNVTQVDVADTNNTVPTGSIPWSLWQIANAAATISGFAAASSIGGPFATTVHRASMITPFSCAQYNATDLPFAFHPLRISIAIGGPSRVEQFVSAAIGNTILMFGIFLVHGIAAGVGTGKMGGWKLGFGFVGFPGSAAFAGLQMLGPPTVGMALTVVLADVEVPGISSTISLVCMVLAILPMLAGLACLTKFFYARGVPCGRMNIPWVFAPTVMYGDRSKRRRGFVDSFGRMFMSCSYKRQWFPIIDLIVACIQLGLLATRPRLDDCDDELFIPIVISQVLFLFAVLVLDPWQNFFDRMTCFVMTALIAAGNIAGAVLDPRGGDGGEEWATTIDRVAVAVMFLAFLYACASIGLAILRWKRGLKFRAPDVDSDDDSDDEVMAERARKKAEAEGLLNSDKKIDPSIAQYADAADNQTPLLDNVNCNHEEQDPEIAMILLRGQWIRLRDPATGAPYYYNQQLQQTSWDLRRDLGLGALRGKRRGVIDLSDDDEDSRWRRRQKRKERERRRKEKKKGKKKKKEDPVKIALEKGEWKEVKDAQGKVYYHNPTTNATTWDLYKELGVEKPVDKVKEALESGEWKEVKDESSGKTYYHNPKTNATTWDLAAELGVESSEEDDDSDDDSDSDFSSSSSAASPRGAAPSLDTLTSLLAATSPLSKDGSPTLDNASPRKSDAVQKAIDSGEWLELRDPTTGGIFYYNPKTQQTTNDLESFLADLLGGTWIPIPDPNDPNKRLLLNTVTKAVRPDPNSSTFLHGLGNSPGTPYDRTQFKHLPKRIRRRVKRLLQSGEWVMFVDPLTNLPCYKHLATGRIAFDLAREVSQRDAVTPSSSPRMSREVSRQRSSLRRRSSRYTDDDDLYEMVERPRAMSRHASAAGPQRSRTAAELQRQYEQDLYDCL